jgi:class 3 adenylate cyclase
MKTTGNGIPAAFDGAGRTIRCAVALAHELAGIGLQLRAGLHTGEAEMCEVDVGGIAVHIAARVLAVADSGRFLALGRCALLCSARTSPHRILKQLKQPRRLP